MQPKLGVVAIAASVDVNRLARRQWLGAKTQTQVAFPSIFPDLLLRIAYSQVCCSAVQLHWTFTDLLRSIVESSFGSAVRTGCGLGDAFQATPARMCGMAVDIGASSARKCVLAMFPFRVAEHCRCHCSGRLGRHEHRRTWHLPHSWRADPATRVSGSPPRLCPADISRSSRNRSPSP
jgi:hypothetical protein